MDSIILSNGYNIPLICYGTDIVDSQMFDNNSVKQVLKRIRYFGNSVLHHSYRKYKKEAGIIKCTEKLIETGSCFFDTSRAYLGSEMMINKSLKKYPREKYYICTKLCCYDQLNNVSAREAIQESLIQLGTDYIDIYLLHWPVTGKYLEYWKQLEELYDEGLVRAIGVSNCKIHHLEEIKKIARIMPMVDEVELHPLLTEMELRTYCKQNNIQIMAYTSTARLDFRLKTSRRMEIIRENYNKSLSQIILRWHIQNGIIPIFNTSTVNHLKDNMDIFDFELTDEEMSIIEGMNINSRTRYDSDNCEWDRL